MILEALERIPGRFAPMQNPGDFQASASGLEHMDSICRVLIAAGEGFKQIDRNTKGKLFAAHPQIAWRNAIGLRDVLAHGYFQGDPEQLYAIYEENVLLLAETLRKMIKDLKTGAVPDL